MYDAALDPRRVYAGVVEQHDGVWDASCLFLLDLHHPGLSDTNVRVNRVEAEQAKGVVWARAQAQDLWNGEDFVLQIDSHTRFECSWDETLVLMHNSLNSSMAVITAYPPSFAPFQPLPKMASPSRLGATHFDEADGMMRLRGVEIGEGQCGSSGMAKSLFWAAGFSFSSSLSLTRVPYDSRLTGLFFGEETVMAARLWTNGFDFYAPCQNVVYHRYDRAYRPTTFGAMKRGIDKGEKALKRVVQLLLEEEGGGQDGEGEGERGLGKARTVTGYEVYANVSFRMRKVGERAVIGVPPPP